MHSEESNVSSNDYHDKSLQEYKELEDEYRDNFHTSDQKLYYIISKK